MRTVGPRWRKPAPEVGETDPAEEEKEEEEEEEEAAARTEAAEGAAERWRPGGSWPHSAD